MGPVGPQATAPLLDSTLATSLTFGYLIDTIFDSVSGNADRPISW